MEQLLNAVHADEWVVVRSVCGDRRDLDLRLELFRSLADPPSVWLVACHRVREFSLTDFEGGGLNFWRDDHPLLSQYSSPKASLQVRVSGADRDVALGVLWRTHVQAVDDWIDFDRFVHPARLFERGGDTVTISGPRFLVEAYTAGLTSANFRADLKVHKRRLYWDGKGWSEHQYDVSVLHFGGSFVVAEQFAADPMLTADS